MEMKRLTELSQNPSHFREQGANPISFYLDDYDSHVIFYPEIESGIIKNLFYHFEQVILFRGLTEAMCSVLSNRPWYSLFHLNMREIKSFISDGHGDEMDFLSADLMNLNDMGKGLASLIGKSLLCPPERAYKGNFIEDLAVLEETWSKNQNSLFPDGSVVIRLETFRPPVIGVKIETQIGVETDILELLKENLPMLTGHTQWKLVAL